MPTAAAPFDHGTRAGVLAVVAAELRPTARDAFAEALNERGLGAGEYLMHKGEEGNSLHIVVEGTLEVVSPSLDGREIVFRHLGPGQVVGELTVADGARRLASVRSPGSARVLSISRSRFRELALAHAEIGLWLARLCSAKTRRLSEWAEGTSFHEIDARLASLLLEEAIDSGAGGAFTIEATQQSFADRLGVSRESINKCLRQWAEADILSTSRGRVHIHRPEELTRWVQY